jgi:DNA-directed RNA polymerase subunit RPC12/RpoP
MKNYCVNCGSQNTETELGVNGSDYIVCGDCGKKYNVFYDYNEEEDKEE